MQNSNCPRQRYGLYFSSSFATDPIAPKETPMSVLAPAKGNTDQSMPLGSVGFLNSLEYASEQAIRIPAAEINEMKIRNLFFTWDLLLASPALFAIKF